ncbi:hypothetical protein MLD38_025246 [Melastoma candidum]|uniref:Uncharacterized protein n=1 Tax=Melastoma candidum TaxID=119954 RepID=A0ACB9NUV2_9MYRT|nr:hypothetical protein MLD38_025246 [Melastoma candidum]
MEPLGAAAVTAFPGKSRKGKIEFTGKPPNVPTEVPPHEPFIKTRTIPTAINTAKVSTDFSGKTLRNPREVSVVVRQTPITFSPGGTGNAGVTNLKPKQKSSPPSSAPKTSSQKTCQVDPKPQKSAFTLEKSPSNPKEDYIVASQTPVSSATRSTAKHWTCSLNPKLNDGTRALSAADKKFYPEKATNLDPKPKMKGICLPGTLMGKTNGG